MDQESALVSVSHPTNRKAVAVYDEGEAADFDLAEFALTEASYVTVRLLQRFDAISASAHELEGTVTSNLTLTSCPARPVTLKLHEAKQ